MSSDAALPTRPPFERVLRFGRFSLDPTRKLLLGDGVAVRLGGRALDLLIALVERAGEVVSHDELFARVWPRTVVEESSLRVHLSALRKALGESPQARYIASVPGRGYSFVMPVDVGFVPEPAARAKAPAGETDAVPLSTLPGRLANVLGRDEVLDVLATRVAMRRLVTIVGPGGIGKTTVALALAERVACRQRHGAVFVDLAPIVDAALVPAALAAAIGVPLPTQDAWPVLRAALSARELLVVLDNCEHVIAAAAQLAERVLRAAPGVRLLATSREPLDAESESVHRLESLALPPPRADTSVAGALGFSALRLFVERATASADDFALTPANVEAVLQVCRHLDGVPLAIELAAARVGSLGIHALAARLDDVFSLLKRGRRTALPRHQTLQALLDWSHDLLDEDERRVLRRLSAFRSSFLLDTAAALASGDDIDRRDAIDCILGLVAKSLVEFEGGSPPRYRLLFVTRAYAEAKLAASGESQAVSARHARCLCELLVGANLEYARGDTVIPAWLARHTPAMPDVRAALEWAARPEGDELLGAALVAESGLVALVGGMSEEFLRRALAALAAVRAAPSAPELKQLEMRLLIVLGYATGIVDTSYRLPGDRGDDLLRLSGCAGSPFEQRLALDALCVGAFGVGDYVRVAALLPRFEGLPPDPLDPGDRNAATIAHRFGAHVAHYMGDHARARQHAASLVALAALPANGQAMPLVPARLGSGLQEARILWLEGHADSALDEAMRAYELVEQASPFGRSQLIAMGIIPVLLWRGDDAQAAVFVDRLVQHVRLFGQTFWSTCLHGFCRVLELRGHDVDDIRARLLPQSPNTNVPATDLLATLADEFCGSAQLARVEAGAVGWCAPEVLRVHGERLATDPQRRVSAEVMLQRALNLAHRQGAHAWALRAATSLSTLWQAEGRAGAARDLLAAELAGLTEGLDCADPRRARALLAAWRGGDSLSGRPAAAARAAPR